jgi:hypothetical protein
MSTLDVYLGIKDRKVLFRNPVGDIVALNALAQLEPIDISKGEPCHTKPGRLTPYTPHTNRL